MNDNLRNQIYDNFNLRETEDLVEIWQTNDRVEWSEEAFDVIREILLERMVELPQQNEPILEHIKKDPAAELIDAENPPIFYKPYKVLMVEKWLNRVALASILLLIATGLHNMPDLQKTIWSFAPSNKTWYIAAWAIAFNLSIVLIGIECAIYCYSLKALGFILKVLMEMEFNSRGVAKKVLR